MAIYSDGTVYLKAKKQQRLKKCKCFSDLNHIILNGQSLGNGNESTQQFLLHLQFTVQNLFFRSKNLELLVA
jgi:hypothetical protein